MNLSCRISRIIVLTSLSFLFSFQAKSQDFVLNGNAFDLGGDCYRLTQNLNTQNGSAWATDQLDLTEPFDQHYLVYLGNSDAGADGICFVLQTGGTAVSGVGGGGVGYEGIPNSLAVEIDTWQNGEQGDPFYDHIGIISAGNNSHTGPTALSPAVQANVLSTNIEDGNDHLLQITWDPETMELKAYFDCELRATSTTDIINDVFGGESLVYFGFTGSTGGANNVQTFCLTEPTGSIEAEVAICDGGSAVLSVGGSSDGTYLWSPADGLSSTTAANPVATPLETTVYTVDYTDFCGITSTGTYTVYVEDLNLQLEGPSVITCIDDSLIITATANPLFDLDYSWTTDGFIVGSSSTETIMALIDGTYTVSVEQGDACFGSAEILIIEDFETYSADVLAAANINCDNDEVVLTGVTDGSDATVSWSTSDGDIISGGSTLNPTIGAPGNYVMTVINPSNGCDSEADVQVNGDITPPEVFAGNPDSLSCSEPIITITGASTNAFNPAATWSTVNGSILSGQNSLNPTIDGPGVYTLTITNLDNGCSASSDVLISISEEGFVDLSNMVFPNIFSPNGDLINQYFFPYLEDEIAFDVTSVMDDYTLYVFNRWGNQVYEWKEGKDLWDGTNESGTDLGPGTYYVVFEYTIDCGTVETGTRSAYVQLVR